MIKYDNTNPVYIKLMMNDSEPSVYLDHWALMTFAENKNYSDRLIESLKNQEGTLHLSWVNIAEFAKISSKETIRSCEQFINDLIPNLFFIESDPFEVAEKEFRGKSQRLTSPPHGDLDTLSLIHDPIQKERNSLTATGLFDQFQGPRAELILADTRELILSGIKRWREEVITDNKLTQRVKKLPNTPYPYERTTLTTREILRSIVLDKNMGLNDNDAFDFMHTCVPLAYSSYLLLDKKWADFATRARVRFETIGMHSNLAKVFSAKGNGVEKFLCDIEKIGS